MPRKKTGLRAGRTTLWVRVQHARFKRGITMAKVCREVGYSRASVYHALYGWSDGPCEAALRKWVAKQRGAKR